MPLANAAPSVYVVDRTRAGAAGADPPGEADDPSNEPDIVIRESPTGGGLLVEGYADGAALKSALEFMSAHSALRGAMSQQGREGLLRVLLAAGADLVEPASLRQARRQAALVSRLLSTPAFTYATLAEVRGDASASATRTWVSRARKDARLFSVSHCGRTLLPALQFDETGDVRDDVASLVQPLSRAGMGGMQVWAWLVSPTTLLSGLVPADAVADPETAGRARLAAVRMGARIRPTDAPSAPEGSLRDEFVPRSPA